MKRPTHLMSVPVDIPRGPAQLDELFKGIALYNTGLISVAYNVPVALRQVVLFTPSGKIVHPVGATALAESQIHLEFEAKFYDGDHPFLVRR